MNIVDELVCGVTAGDRRGKTGIHGKGDPSIERAVRTGECDFDQVIRRRHLGQCLHGSAVIEVLPIADKDVLRQRSRGT